jgi:hypothetical protein
MVWSSIATEYLKLFDEIRSSVWTSKPLAAVRSESSISAANLPAPGIDQLLRLSDDTGPARYARYSIPDWKFGYSIDDASGTLVACIKFYTIYKDQKALALAETCMGLLSTLIADGNASSVSAGLDYTREKKGRATDENVAKALWALGYVVNYGPAHLSPLAYDLFNQIFPDSPYESKRAAAYTILAASNYLHIFPGASIVKKMCAANMSLLGDYFLKDNWVEEWTYSDWPLAIQAYSVGGNALNDSAVADEVEKLINRAIDFTSGGKVFLSPKDDNMQNEFSIIAGTFIEALGAHYNVTRDSKLLIPIRAAVDWFLGANRLNTPIYDFSTKGCHDALSATGLNRNQSTEATVHFLLALLSLNHIIALQETSINQNKSGKNNDKR